MNHKDFIKDSTNMKFFNVICKFRNGFRMEKLLGMKKSEFVMMITIDSNIKEHGKATVSQISKAMKMINADIYRTIGDLEDNEYVIKKVNKQDKREVYIELTVKGEQQLELIKSEAQDFSKAVFERFGTENADQLIQLLETMYEVMSEEYSSRINNKTIQKGIKKC